MEKRQNSPISRARMIQWWRSGTWVATSNFAEGIPYVAVNTISMIMYKRLGLSNTEITLYTSMFYLPWVIKPLWSPFIDIFKTKRFWIISMEIVLAMTQAGVALTIPTSLWLQSSILLFWLMAFASATHDIAVDGFYMLGLDTRQQSMFIGLRSTMYRIAMLFGSGFLVMVAGNMETITRNIRYSWSIVFYIMAGIFVGLCFIHAFLLPRPHEDRERKGLTAAKVVDELRTTITTFFNKKGVVYALLFMLFYRMPEGFLTKICPLFLMDAPNTGGLGLSPTELGFVQGTVGVIGLLVGGIAGGIFAGTVGLKKALWPMVCAITLPDIVYVYLSYMMPSSLMVINACVLVEQLGYGFGFSAYMLYLIYYSRGEHKTSHYALCTAFMALSLVLPGAVAGWLQEHLGYRLFFIVIMASTVVTFIVASLVKIDPRFGKKEE